jgi:hypothetical protein
MVRDRTTGAGLGDIRVAVSALQQESGIVQTAAGEGRTDLSGRFTLCGLPPLVPVTLRFDGAVGTASRVVTPEAGRLVAVPVLLPDAP